MSNVYQHNFTWSHPLGEHCIAHTDGAVSCFVTWAGLDSDLLTEVEINQQYVNLMTLIHSLPEGYFFEFHLWREYDNKILDEYLALNNRIVRNHDIAKKIRQDHAKHLEQYSMENTVGLVITTQPVFSFFPNAKKQLIKQSKAADQLLYDLNDYIRHFPAATILSHVDYQHKISQTLNRPHFIAGHKKNYDPHYLLNEQLVSKKPAMENERLSQEGHHIKTLFVFMYPDAYPAWSKFISQLPCPLHISAIIKPINTKKAITKTEQETDLSEGIMSRRGRDVANKGLHELSGFRRYVSDNGLRIFQNAYIINVYGSAEDNLSVSHSIVDWIESHGGEVRHSDYLQYPYFRFSQMGQGYLSALLRPDHSEQVANMLPVQVFNNGDKKPESIRLGSARQIVKFDISSKDVAHVFTAAMTRGGKGVDAVTTIAELYPMGTDFNIIEVGGSYKWLVESFGGTYTTIDPSETAINPFPLYSVADVNQELPLSVEFANGTVNSLAFLLTDGRTDLTVHEDAAAQLALQFCYVTQHEDKDSPTLEIYLDSLRSAKEYNDKPKQLSAANEMAAKLESFLSTQAGRVFLKNDNLIIDGGITGIDLKDVEKASPKLLQFYLVFISLKLTFNAFASRNRSFIVLDELHKFVKSKPEIVGKLASEIVRMGAKENTFLWLISQGIEEVEAIERSVIENMPMRNLLYRTGSHQEIAERIAMPEGALNVWKGFDYPIGKPYRPAIRSIGDDYHHLHLTFPELLLDLADTSPAALTLKERIGMNANNPMAKLAEFSQLMAEHKHA